MPLASAGTPTYSSGDVVSLSVAADGSLQAHAAAVGIPVIATLQVDNVTHTDTSYVDIRDEGVPSPIANISIHPQAPDSAKIAAAYSFPKQLVVRAQDVQGDSVAGLHVEFRSSDPTIAFVDPLNGFVTGERAGNVLIIATATIYGASHVDTLPFAVGLPITYIVNVAPSKVPNSTPSTTFTPSEIHVGRGAVVSFAWVVDIRPVDITFDDPTHVAEDTVNFFGGHTGGGDIAPPDGCKSAVPFASLLNCIKGRAFPDAGVYAYHSTLTGAAGQVIVVDESASGNP
ncbi:MAG TPA: hypothetical protein VGO46_06180 [Gemmatimonadaceae bacterium]|nr:hypothetical protein [Gemmatimonadaceae bacterium]